MKTEQRWLAELRRQRGLVLVGLLGLVFAVYGTLSFYLGRPRLAAIHLVGAGSIALVWAGARRAEDAPAVIVHGGAAFTTLTLAGIALLSGQGSSLAWWYITLVPLFVAQLGGWRACLGWALVAAAVIAAVHLSEGWITIRPEHEFGALETRLGVLVLAVLALGYAAYVQRTAETQMVADHTRRTLIAEQHDELAKVKAELEELHAEALRESNAKTQLMARVSHEIRTPLNGLLGLSEVLADAPLDPAHLEMVRSLHASASALRQLVDDLLDVTRIQDGRVTLHYEAADLRELVGDVVDMFGVLAHDKGLQLAAIVEDSVPARVKIDTLRVRQVASNLVGNALKFTTSGEVVVRVSGKTQDGVFAGRIEVRDTGPGIEPDLLPRIFEAFEQAEDNVSLRRQGTGLGLWISRELARALGGELGASSEPGRGSNFHFTFRADVEDIGAGSASAILIATARVLVVEPHRASRRALSALAAAAGYELRAVGAVDEARDAARLAPPDILIIDAAVGPSDALERMRLVAPDARAVVARSPAAISAPLPKGFVAATLKPYRASRLRGLLMDVLPEDPTPEVGSDVPRMRCLVVDDDPTNRMVARLLLERSGQEVTLAADTRTAETIVRAGDVEVVFCDIHMPEEDGATFVRRLRQDFDRMPPLWIVALTAATSEQERREYVEAGMDDYLAKPIEVGLLRAALERAHRAVRRRLRESSSIARSQVLSSLLEEDTFDQLARNLAEDIHPLVEEFIDGSEQHVVQIADASARGEPERARRAAHTLKSSAALVGATRLAALARRIEAGIDAGELPDERALSELGSTRDASVARLEARARHLFR